MKVLKRDGKRLEHFNLDKIINAVNKAYLSKGKEMDKEVFEELQHIPDYHNGVSSVKVETLQNEVEKILMDLAPYDVAKAYIIYREKHNKLREFTQKKLDFINKYKNSDNTANATIDDNSNVSNHNIAVLNAEIHKEDNKEVNLRIWQDKLKELYPNFNYKQLVEDSKSICYLHDLSSQIGMPYCVAISMYPFLLNGIKDIGGLSASPKNIDSFCGMFVNLVFAVASQFKGAVATPGVLLCMDWFLRKEWGDFYYEKEDLIISSEYSKRKQTLKGQIHQYFQQICYSLMQPSGSRGSQACFWNLSIFDKPFFDTMYGDFQFPDGSRPKWESLKWLQMDFLHWLNQERLKCILTFPVVSACLIYKDGKFIDEELYQFLAQEYSEGNSFFTYISDSADSLSSCCFDKGTKILWKNSYDGVKCTTLEELHNIKWKPYKKNLRIFHNGSWVKGKSIKLPNRNMYKVTTYNNKEFIMSDNHINITYNGEKPTSSLTTEDYLMFNTSTLNAVSENDEHLTYEQGLLVGLFIGDGTFGNYVCKDGSVHNFQLSLNKEKWDKVKDKLSALGEFYLGTVYNNVYPIKCYNKELTTFISKWTTNEPNNTTALNKSLNINCLLQSIEFRKGILDGWYITDGGNSNRCYTVSKPLVDAMEILCTSLGLQTIIDISDRTDEAVIIRGQEYDRNYPLYCLRWYTEANHRTNKTTNKSWKKKNNSIYWKIKNIESIDYTDDIYCIECSNQDEPYFTLPSGLITHNCRLSSKISKPQFNFTNGQLSEMTGSKNVITLNLNRIVQDWAKEYNENNEGDYADLHTFYAPESGFKNYLIDILDRVYKYQIAYNEVLKDLFKSNLLTVYNAGFIDMKKQYLTIGINGLNQAAEFLDIKCNKNKDYEKFCNTIFSIIKEQNTLHKTKELMFNTEFTPWRRVVYKPLLIDSKLLNLTKDNEGQAIILCAA